jgi:hypothetical protein
MRLHLETEVADHESQLWVLLSRHSVDTRDTSIFIALHVQMEGVVVPSANVGIANVQASDSCQTLFMH